VSNNFNFEQLIDLCQRTHEEARARASQAIDSSLVARNWLFGLYIVEFEDGGAERSELYGKRLIEKMSNHLKSLRIKGVSSTRLRLYRRFYHAYPQIGPTLSVGSHGSEKIRPTLSVESLEDSLPALLQAVPTLARHFTLGWSQYVSLLTVSAELEGQS